MPSSSYGRSTDAAQDCGRSVHVISQEPSTLPDGHRDLFAPKLFLEADWLVVRCNFSTQHKITHLVINPDHSLNLLPFALLREADGSRLFDRKKVSLVPTLPHFINALLRSNLDHNCSWSRLVTLADTHSGAGHFALETRLVRSVFGDREVLIHTTEEFNQSSFIRDVQPPYLHTCCFRCPKTGVQRD